MKEARAAKTASALENAQAAHDDRSNNLDCLRRDSEEQDRKLARAERCRESLGRALRGSNPGADAYERDMDLRAAKERQRAAMIKLRELSLASSEGGAFAAACRAETERIGLAAPAVSRVEAGTTAAAAMSRSASVSRGINGGGGGGFYRGRRSSSGSRATAAAAVAAVAPTTSVLVMELATAPMARPHRQQTSVPQLPVVH